MKAKFKVYYEKDNYVFDGVNWVKIKPKFDDSYLLGYKGFSFLEEFYPAQINCPYIPQFTHDSGSKQIQT